MVLKKRESRKKPVPRKSKDAEIRKRIERACQILGNHDIAHLFRRAGEHTSINSSEIERCIRVHIKELQEGRINPPKWLRTYVNLIRKGKIPVQVPMPQREAA